MMYLDSLIYHFYFYNIYSKYIYKIDILQFLE